MIRINILDVFINFILIVGLHTRDFCTSSTSTSIRPIIAKRFRVSKHFEVNTINDAGSIYLFTSFNLLPTFEVCASKSLLRKPIAFTHVAVKLKALRLSYFWYPISHKFYNSRDDIFFSVRNYDKFSKLYLWEFDWVLRHHITFIRCEQPCWRPWDSKWKLNYIIRFCFDKCSHKRIGTAPLPITFYCTECKHWQTGNKSLNQCNHFGPQYSSDDAGDGPDQRDVEFRKRMTYYNYMMMQGSINDLPLDFLSHELVPISEELSAKIDNYISSVETGDRDKQKSEHPDSAAASMNRVKEAAMAALSSEVNQTVAYYALEKPAALKALKKLLQNHGYNNASDLPPHLFQMLPPDLQRVDLKQLPVPILPDDGFMAGSINVAHNKRDMLRASREENDSSDDSEEYNLLTEEGVRGKRRRINSRKEPDTIPKKKTNPNHCASCGCRNWSNEGGCCTVCRWYGDRGKKCICSECAFADGIAYANPETKQFRKSVESVLKVEHNHFDGLSKVEKNDERRNKINVCIRDETRSDYHYKYDLEVGRPGYAYACCMNGFMGFYDMSESSFDRRVREIKSGQLNPSRLASHMKQHEAAGFSKLVSEKYSYVQNDDEAWATSFPDVPIRAGKDSDHHRKVEECHSWMKAYFRVNAEHHPNRDGFRYLRQAAMNKIALHELYVEEVKPRVDSNGTLDYKQFCKVSA